MMPKDVLPLDAQDGYGSAKHGRVGGGKNEVVNNVEVVLWVHIL